VVADEVDPRLSAAGAASGQDPIFATPDVAPADYGTATYGRTSGSANGDTRVVSPSRPPPSKESKKTHMGSLNRAHHPTAAQQGEGLKAAGPTREPGR